MLGKYTSSKEKRSLKFLFLFMIVLVQNKVQILQNRIIVSDKDRWKREKKVLVNPFDVILSVYILPISLMYLINRSIKRTLDRRIGYLRGWDGEWAKVGVKYFLCLLNYLI